MREELLAHVVGVFEEESAKLGDDRAALERTALRFGNPAEVTSQLQESVPARDTIRRFFEGRPGEATLWGPHTRCLRGKCSGTGRCHCCLVRGGMGDRVAARRNEHFRDTVATVVTGFRIGASTVKGFERPGAFGGPLFAVHVQGESLFDVPLGPHAVDALLRLAETPVASLHCVACCPQQLIVQIQQRLLQVRAVQHGQRSGQPLETPHPLTQLLQTPQRRGRLAAAVKQPIHLVHDVAQDT